MIYSIESPQYYNFLCSAIPEKLANRPEFISYFNLECNYGNIDMND